MEATNSTPAGHDPVVDVLLAGMVFLDIVFTDMHAPCPGHEVWAGGMGSSPGGIANLATATARLDLSTCLVAAFSDDGYGRWCRDILQRQERVDLSRSRTFSDWHSPVTVSLSYDGDRAMVTHGHDSPVPLAEMLGTPPGARAVIAELQAEPWWLGARDAGALVFADVGWDPTEVWDRSVLDRLDGCHAFTPNEVEAMAYTRTDSPPAALAALAERVPLAVVTLGARGAIAVDQTTGEQAGVTALDVPAIDPTGAGDVFAAALVAGTLDAWPLADRLKFAALAASLAVQQFGGGLAAPGWGDIADWWARTMQRADAGSAADAALARDYGFLPGVLSRHEGRAVRRAEATIAQLADV
ncbi:PfkB family carbohydrate kinase [Propionicimonas sp.]|uniref:PfkB family carbohydrate kinase n=1 Tax=Propionicimonas sp. TaxID=1955623 RepID=UPI0039E5F9A4